MLDEYQKNINLLAIEKDYLNQLVPLIQELLNTTINNLDLINYKNDCNIKLWELANKIPGSIYIKNKFGQYVYQNSRNISEIGIQVYGETDEVVGKKLHWQDKIADIFMQEDEIVLNKKGIISGHLTSPCISYTGRLVMHVLNKIPIHNYHDDVIGIFGVGFNIIHLQNPVTLYKLYQELFLNRKLAFQHYLENTNLGNLKASISQKQLECLLYLSTGKTYKEIAKILKISPRTVESYIDEVKIKLNKGKKKELTQLFWDAFNKNIPITTVNEAKQTMESDK